MNIKGINQLYMCKKELRNILYTERTYDKNKFKSKIVIDVIIEKNKNKNVSNYLLKSMNSQPY